MYRSYLDLDWNKPTVKKTFLSQKILRDDIKGLLILLDKETTVQKQ